MNTTPLKAKILDLAIRGKLVPQDPSEGNAADLLKKIREEKSILIEQKKIKAEKNSSYIIKAEDGRHYEQFANGSLIDIEDDIPFEIPETWCWCRLTQICEYGKCKNAEPADLDPNSWILDLEDIEKDTGKIKQFKTFEERNSLSTKHVFTEGTVLYSKLRPYLNKVVIAPKDGFCTSEILPLDFQGLYINKFAQILLMSPYFLSTVNMLTYGVKMPRLGTNEAKQIFVPLPPLSEQQRIFSAIENAFEQIDIIEKNKLNLKTYIKQTKSKVLDLAIHGKLVEQNPSEGNARDLLKIEEVIQDDIPFEIPMNWCWCKGKEIFSQMTSKKPEGEEFKYIDIESVDNKLQKIHHPKIMKTSNAPSRASRETRIGDVVFSMVRPYLKNIARISENLENCIASTGFFVCRPKEFIDSKYCYYLMISSYVVNGLNQFMKGDNSPSINSDDITDFLYPIPPIEEQKRIIDRIEQIFEQLDILEKSLGE